MGTITRKKSAVTHQHPCSITTLYLEGSGAVSDWRTTDLSSFTQFITNMEMHNFNITNNSNLQPSVTDSTNSLKRWRSQVRASSYDSNKSTNKMQQFRKFITWRLCVAQHVSGASMPIIRTSTTAVAASGFTVGEKRLARCWSYSGRLSPAPSAVVCSWWWAGRRPKRV